MFANRPVSHVQTNRHTDDPAGAGEVVGRYPLRRQAPQPLERVKIPLLGWSLSVVGLSALAAAAPLRAQEPRPAPPATHTVKRGDTLWDIARTYLGDPYLWPAIYRVNTDQIEDPHWIYPGEVLRLPSGQPAVVATQPEPSTRTVFSPATTTRASTGFAPAAGAPQTRVARGDVVRAAFDGPEGGPRGAGKVLFGADIPGIDKERLTSNFQLYDRVLMAPPVGSVAAERERFLAYSLGDRIEGFGTIVIPTAVLEVIRAPRNGEAATVQVRELFGMLNADAPVMALDTAGSGSTAMPVSLRDGKVTEIRAIHRNAVLPSVNYEVLFQLSSRDGMRVGDEIEIFRPREKEVAGERLAIPEVAIGTGQVIRVTPYGSTARVTSQSQPAIRVGESVRVTARMP